MKKINSDLEKLRIHLRDAEDILFSILCKSSITENSIKPMEKIGYTNIFESRSMTKRLMNSLDTLETDLHILNSILNLHEEFYYVSTSELSIFDLINSITENQQIFFNKEAAIKEVDRINNAYKENYARNNQEYPGNTYKVYSYNRNSGIFEELK